MVEIDDAGDNVKFDAVMPAFVAITIGKDFEGFQVCDDMLDLDAQPCKSRVVGFFLSIQWGIFRCFIRKISVWMNIRDALIA